MPKYSKHYYNHNIKIHKLNAKIKKTEEKAISDYRKCFLYNSLLSHLESIYDEDTLYTTLLSLGFTKEEIEYEGLTPEKDTESEICISCEDCGGCDCEGAPNDCCAKSKVPTETKTEETCCGKKYIYEENCHDCNGCSCDGTCNGGNTDCNKNKE